MSLRSKNLWSFSDQIVGRAPETGTLEHIIAEVKAGYGRELGIAEREPVAEILSEAKDLIIRT